MKYSVLNILDLVASVGIENTNEFIEGFTTRIKGDADPLNQDIEDFLKKNSIQFAKEKKSITYLVCDEDNRDILGYFTLAHKAIEVPSDGLSKSTIRRIEKYAQFHPTLGSYVISAFLLAQIGKNYGIEEERRITGDALMTIAFLELQNIQHRIGGGLVYLDSEANAKLIQFYQNKQSFRLFGERISSKDGKRYLQYMKFF